MKNTFLTGMASVALGSAMWSCAPTAKTPPTVSTATETPATSPAAAPNWRAQADVFLQQYSIQYQQLYTQSAEAEWRSNTRIVPGDTTNAAATARANQAMAAFTGSTENHGTFQKELSLQNQAFYPVCAGHVAVALAENIVFEALLFSFEPE